jgi:hypothetical protein
MPCSEYANGLGLDFLNKRVSVSYSGPTYPETLRRERQGLAVEGLHWEGNDVVVVALARSLWASQGLFRESSLRVKIGAPH